MSPERIEAIRSAANSSGLFGEFLRFIGVPDLLDALAAQTARAEAAERENEALKANVRLVREDSKDEIRRLQDRVMVLSDAAIAYRQERDALARETERLRAGISEALRLYELWLHCDPVTAVAHIAEPLTAAIAAAAGADQEASE